MALVTAGEAAGLRALVYVRVSTKEQDPRPQFAALRDLARLRGWRIVGVYRERKSSTLARPALRRCLHDAAMRRGDVVLVWALDRVGRKLTEVVANVERLTERGVGLVSLRDGAIDTTQASGRLILAVMAACAQFERERLVERTREALALRKRRGVQLGRPRKANGAQLEEAGRAIAGGSSLAAAARAAGLSARTLRRRLMEAYGTVEPAALARRLLGKEGT